MSSPRITVLMSVHNGGRWLRPAIESVLAQTWQNFEFLILDDASTDDSVAQIESYHDPRIRLLRLPQNIGLTRSLNRGLREAKGEWIARQDADDLAAPERLAKQVAFLEARPEVALLGSRARLIDAAGRSRGVRDLPLESAAIRWLALLDNPIIHTAVMTRTRVLRDEFGGYNESFPCCQDYDLWARIMARHPVANLPERLVAVREHGGSISATRQGEARVMVARVVRMLADTWLPGLALSDAEIATLCAYRRHLAPAEVAPFHTLLTRIEASFAKHFPEAQGNRDLTQTRAGVFARIAYNLMTHDRRLAIAELRRAFSADPKVSVRLPWLRLSVLFLLGEHARRLASQTTGRA